MARSSIYVGEIAHQSPIPNASRIGNIIVSGLIRGADPATAKLAATLEQQCAFMFLHMRQAVEAGGATVVLSTVPAGVPAADQLVVAGQALDRHDRRNVVRPGEIDSEPLAHSAMATVFSSV